MGHRSRNVNVVFTCNAYNIFNNWQEHEGIVKARPEVARNKYINGVSIDETPWAESARLPATRETIDALFCGKLAALCVPGFLHEEACLKLAQRVEEMKFGEYENVSPPMGRIGITVFEYERTGKRAYFTEVARMNSMLSRIFDGVCDPVQEVMKWLSHLSPEYTVRIVHEENYGDYFAGLLRRIEDGTLVHVDFAPLEQPNWAVGAVESQLTWNIYVHVSSADPGIVHIWQKQWDPADEVYKMPASYGYRAEVLQGVLSII